MTTTTTTTAHTKNTKASSSTGEERINKLKNYAEWIEGEKKSSKDNALQQQAQHKQKPNHHSYEEHTFRQMKWDSRVQKMFK